MKRHLRLMLLLPLAMPLVGCRGYYPPFWGPGTIEQQRLSASVHDPYPDNDLGPPVVGGRPHDFQQQMPEVVRNRWVRDQLP